MQAGPKANEISHAHNDSRWPPKLTSRTLGGVHGVNLSRLWVLQHGLASPSSSDRHELGAVEAQTGLASALEATEEEHEVEFLDQGVGLLADTLLALILLYAFEELGVGFAGQGETGLVGVGAR